MPVIVLPGDTLGNNLIKENEDRSNHVNKCFLKLFPNPTSNEVFISLLEPEGEIAEVSVRSLEGKIIFKKNISTSLREYLLSTNQFAPGVYFVEVRNKRGNVSTSLLSILK